MGLTLHRNSYIVLGNSCLDSQVVCVRAFVRKFNIQVQHRTVILYLPFLLLDGTL